MVKKWISEFVGTMLLVIFGCGTAVAVNTYVSNIYTIPLPFTILVIALAFGLILTALAYTIGKVSGAHVNPAVSIACLIDGRIGIVECVEYVVLQVLGGIAGAAILMLIFGGNTALGANGFAAASALQDSYMYVNVTDASTMINVTAQVAFIVETILTFVFVSVVLATTKKDNGYAGLVIGLTLALVHIFGIVFTGTSVNPARSIGPALLSGGEALSQLWVFILAPLVGGILAALFYRFVIDNREDAYVAVSDDEDEEVEEVKAEPKKTKTTTTKKKSK